MTKMFPAPPQPWRSVLKRASQVQLGLSTFNLLFYFTEIFKTTLALEAGPNKWSNRIPPFTGFTGVRGVSSQATMPPPRHLGVGVTAVMRSSPQIKLNVMRNLVKLTLRDSLLYFLSCGQRLRNKVRRAALGLRSPAILRCRI